MEASKKIEHQHKEMSFHLSAVGFTCISREKIATSTALHTRWRLSATGVTVDVLFREDGIKVWRRGARGSDLCQTIDDALEVAYRKAMITLVTESHSYE